MQVNPQEHQATKIMYCLRSLYPVLYLFWNFITLLLQPIDKIVNEISQLNMKRKSSGLFPILVHTDAAQTIGKIPVEVAELQVDYLTIVGHKVICFICWSKTNLYR